MFSLYIRDAPSSADEHLWWQWTKKQAWLSMPASVLQDASSGFSGHLVLRSQRGEKCKEIENGELTVPDVASIEEKPSARSRESYQNTSIVTLI